MEEVSRINSIVLAYGEYLLTATSTAVYHLPSHAPDGGNHTAALAPSLLLGRPLRAPSTAPLRLLSLLLSALRRPVPRMEEMELAAAGGLSGTSGAAACTGAAAGASTALALVAEAGADADLRSGTNTE